MLILLELDCSWEKSILGCSVVVAEEDPVCNIQSLRNKVFANPPVLKFKIMNADGIYIYILDPADVNPKVPINKKFAYNEVLNVANKTNGNKFLLSQDIDNSDLIIAPSNFRTYGIFMEDLKNSLLYNKYRKKLYIYNCGGKQYPFIPGIYTNIFPGFVKGNWACGGHYLSSKIIKHKFSSKEIDESKRDYLLSFVGSSRNHACRQKVFEINHPRGYLHDSNPKKDKLRWWEKDDSKSSVIRFRNITLNTKFLLCPRGVNTSSIRIFEGMEAGCVPIIISDNLVLPNGPNWNEFSMIIPENSINKIPAICEELEPGFKNMSKLSRQAWEKFFSTESSFHSLCTWINSLHGQVAENRNILEKKTLLQSYFSVYHNKQRLYSRIKQMRIQCL